jgi:hypothetical protein
MALGVIATIIIAFLSMFIPGLLLSFALLKKTELHTFEIVVIGFIFGLIAPASMTWAESYLINYSHIFTFSLGVFEINALILAIIGAALCYFEGTFGDFYNFAISTSNKASIATGGIESVRKRLSKYEKGKEIIALHQQEEKELKEKQATESKAMADINPDERARLQDMNTNTLLQLKESHLRSESLMLSDIENTTTTNPKTSKSKWWVWAILLVIMILTFYTRMQSIVISPKFFEFDPYFDMIDAHYILTYGQQLLNDPSAWPVVAAGTNHRLQPIVPYLEAFWYTLANQLKYHNTTFSASLMSYIGGIYPPITAALLVFVIFMLLYHEYDERIGLIAAGLTATMSVLFTTFIAGEQLVEPWGIFALFFFFATYMLAIRDPKDKRLAILAGIAFASNFLGAHYYTVTYGVLIIYIVIEGIIDILRNQSLKDFYLMNIIMLTIITLIYGLYYFYQAGGSNLGSVSTLIFVGPWLALALVAIMDFVPKMLAKSKILIKEANFNTNIGFMVLIAVILLPAIFFTKIGDPLKTYINLSTRFTTPSKPLFMTVQEYIPTGPLYAFGSQGFDALGASTFGVPILVWLICALSIALIFVSIGFRKSKTGILYISIALPLMAAGFSEVKYLPHLGVAYILMFCIILGEVLYFASSDQYKNVRNRDIVIGLSAGLGIVSLLMGFSLYSFGLTIAFALAAIFLVLLVVLLYMAKSDKINYNIKSVYNDHPFAAYGVMIVGLFFLFGLIFVIVAIVFIVFYLRLTKHIKESYTVNLIILCVLLGIFSFSAHSLFYGESASIISSINAQVTYSSSPSTACNLLSTKGNSLGYNSYCNTIPLYWLNSMMWIRENVGPNAPRVLAWWDYGDWINWFGNSNASIKGGQLSCI